jgi:predicted transcriptional regulator of viral defense system
MLHILFEISTKSNIIVFGGANMINTTSMLKNQYSDYSNPLDKIKRDAISGVIFRLTRGIYETDGNVNPCFLASSILSPSYLSFDWALSYYGLIPEKVVAITSASLNVRKNKTFINKFGRYEYSDIPANVFSEGLTYLESDDYIVKIATKEKAICDSLSKWRVVRSINDLKELLFVDKRIDEDEFASRDFRLMTRLAALYNKTNLDLLIKLIRKEYDHE